MGLFDMLNRAPGGAQGQADFISGILSSVGGLQGVVDKLQAAGLDRQVASWLGNGSNLPVTAEQIRSALGNEQVQQVARQLGLPVDSALQVLADHVPNAVDQASPDGRLPPH